MATEDMAMATPHVRVLGALSKQYCQSLRLRGLSLFVSISMRPRSPGQYSSPPLCTAIRRMPTVTSPMGETRLITMYSVGQRSG